MTIANEILKKIIWGGKGGFSGWDDNIKKLVESGIPEQLTKAL